MSFFRENKDGSVEEVIPCSVSKEFVEFIANQSPDTLKDKKGNVILPAVLFFLGFRIDFDRINDPYQLDYYTEEEKRIRCANKPYMTYVTTIYNGYVRKQLNSMKMVDGKKVPVYDKFKWHCMKGLYEKVEVVTVDTIPVELTEDINNIGQIEPYNLGMLNSERRVDPEKKFRQIVR